MQNCYAKFYKEGIYHCVYHKTRQKLSCGLHIIRRKKEETASTDQSFSLSIFSSKRANRTRTSKTEVEVHNQLLTEYLALYGRAHWSYSTYTNHVAPIQSHIPLAFEDMTCLLSINYCTAHLSKRCFWNAQTAIHFIKLHLQKHFLAQWKYRPTNKSSSYCCIAVFLCL